MWEIILKASYIYFKWSFVMCGETFSTGGGLP
jgi:hypothetical protein